MGKERKGWITKKTNFFKKIIHFLHFKTLSSTIIFMRCNVFLSHSVAVSFPAKVISVGISNPIPIFVHSCSCNFATRIRSGQENELVYGFVYLYPKNCFFYSLHPIVPLLLMDNSQKSHKSKNNACRTKDLSAGLRTYKNCETCSRRTPV